MKTAALFALAATFVAIFWLILSAEAQDRIHALAADKCLDMPATDLEKAVMWPFDLAYAERAKVEC